jgi:acylphosphatase
MTHDAMTYDILLVSQPASAKMLFMKRLEATVYGRVQGVSFRHYTQLKANELQLTGWVANQPDGTVYVVAEGPAEQLDQFFHWLHRGSPSARVERVTPNWLDATKEFNRFSIRWFSR